MPLLSIFSYDYFSVRFNVRLKIGLVFPQLVCLFFFKIKGMKPQKMLGSSDNIIFAPILAQKLSLNILIISIDIIFQTLEWIKVRKKIQVYFCIFLQRECELINRESYTTTALYLVFSKLRISLSQMDVTFLSQAEIVRKYCPMFCQLKTIQFVVDFQS